MAEERIVRIVSWPEQPARLEHHLAMEDAFPVAISFDEAPAHVVVSTEPRRPLAINMNLNAIVPGTIPVCIKLCEPICARSEYTIGITIFDRPVASITIRGMTRLFNSGEE